jgi:hypothetical protein
VHDRSLLNATDLRRILMRAIGAHAVADGIVSVDLKVIGRLAKDLRVFSVDDVLEHPEAVAELLASMATMVNAQARVLRYIGESSQEIAALARKIRADFAIECVVFFARSCGYGLYVDPRSRDYLMLALLMRDWGRVVEIFEGSTSRAAIGQGRSDLLYEIHDSSEERHEYARFSFDRKLSTESYSNLVSEADYQQWSAADVLMLIEEYLNPELRPDLVHHSQVVSGEEWRDLYDWLRREDGYAL